MGHGVRGNTHKARQDGSWIPFNGGKTKRAKEAARASASGSRRRGKKK